MGSQLTFHINIRNIATVSSNPVHAVENMIENLQPLVRHADFIKIGKNKTKIEIILLQMPVHGVQFTADILTRFTHQRENLIQIDLFKR